MKKCIHCGAELHDEAAFCHVCAKSQEEKAAPAAPKPGIKKKLRALLATVLVVAIILSLALFFPKGAPEEPEEPAAPAEPATPAESEEPQPKIIESDGAEIFYECEEGTFIVLASYFRKTTSAADLRGVFRNDQTVSPGTSMFMPSFIFVLDGARDKLVEDEFEELVADIHVTATPAEGSAFMDVGVPELYPDVPEVFRLCFLPYSDQTFDTDICWEFVMKNGDILRLHQNLIVNTRPTAEYHFDDYPMNNIDELQSLLDTIRAEHSPDTEITLYLPPVVYDGGITLDSHAFTLVGSTNSETGENTTFRGTVVDNSPEDVSISTYIDLVFEAEGSIGLHAKQTISTQNCVFRGCDVGVYCEGRGWICPNESVFINNGVGIEFDNTSAPKAITYNFNNHIFDSNDVAVRISRCSLLDTLYFDFSTFTGNTADLENLCDQPVDMSNATFR